MRTRTITAAALAAAALAAGPAAAQNSGQDFTDTAGDVATQSAGVYYVAPDILGGRVVFTDGNDFQSVTDDLLGFYATVDSKPAAGVSSELFDGDFLGFWLNTDNNVATGSNPGPVPLGADHRVVLEGIASGQPSTARIDAWNPATSAWVGTTIPGNVVKINAEFGVLVSPQTLGLQRGAAFGYQVLTTNESTTSINDIDFAPNAAPAFSFALPVLQAPPPPVIIQAPVAATTQARSIGSDRATLTGTLDPRGQALSWYFEWGRTARYGNRTARVAVPAGQTGARAVTAGLRRLTAGTRYHYRLVVEPAGAAAVAGADISLRTANLDRLVIAADPDGACQGGACRITGFSVVVRGRDGDTNRLLKLTPKGLTASVRCLSGCSVNTRFRLTGRTTLRAEIGRLVGGRSLPSGATIEVRVTGGSKWVGAAYRATFARNDLVDRICEIRPGARPSSCGPA